MPPLLIAYDGSASARAAVARTAALFPGSAAVVVTIEHGLGELEDAASSARVALSDEVIHTAVERLRESAMAHAREVAEEGARLATEAGLEARGEAMGTDGPTWRGIERAAHAHEAGLVVCGTHGRGAVRRAILGSVTTSLVHHAGLPVLVVPQSSAESDGPLVIAFDDSEHARRATERCAALMPGRAAVVLHVWRSRIRHTLTGVALQHAPLTDVRETVADFDRLLEEWATEEAERGAALARDHGLDAEPRVVETGAPAAQAICDVADELDAVAIVVARRGRGGLAETLLGSVSAGVFHAADRPVLFG